MSPVGTTEVLTHTLQAFRQMSKDQTAFSHCGISHSLDQSFPNARSFEASLRQIVFKYSGPLADEPYPCLECYSLEHNAIAGETRFCPAFHRCCSKFPMNSSRWPRSASAP